MEYLKIGRIISSFGLQGEMKILSSTSFKDKRFTIGNKIFLNNENKQELTINSVKGTNDIFIIKVNEITTKEQAEALKNIDVLCIKNIDDLEEGFYYFSDLEKCKVFDQNKKELGKIKLVEEYPAQVTLRVENNGKQLLIPFIKDFIIKVDIENKSIIINNIEGLI